MEIFQELATDFLLDLQERTRRVEELLLELQPAGPQQRRELIAAAKRELHTIKGNAGMMGLGDIQGLVHGMEDQVLRLDADNPDVEQLLRDLDGMRAAAEAQIAGPASEPAADAATEQATAAIPLLRPEEQLLESVRVSFAELDELVDVLAEMVIFRNRLADAVVKGRLEPNQEEAWDTVEETETALGGTLNVIQDRIMHLRMVPLRSLFVSLKRIVHDVAVDEGKQLELQTAGGDTPMDKALLEVASEALGHLVRNAAIHGIESPAERRRRGKPLQGTIRLSAVTEANEVIIDIADDGGGIDTDALLARAEAHGIDISDQDEPYSLLFHAGLSTHDGTDLGAGRGIGLASAMASVRRLGGRIEVVSQLGTGSRFRLHLPLSVSITRALLLQADDELYALPIANVEESVRFTPGDATEVNHALVFKWRDGVLPLLDLGLVFGSSQEPRQQGFVILVEAAGKRRGLLVDRMAGIREIVVKGLDPMVGSPVGISGSTILGDGRVVLILDASGLMAINPGIRTQEAGDEREQETEQEEHAHPAREEAAEVGAG